MILKIETVFMEIMNNIYMAIPALSTVFFNSQEIFLTVY